MKRVVAIFASAALGAAAMAAASIQPSAAASRCAAATPSSAAEAEQAIRYLTDLMVASSACKNTVYAEFALRNRTEIIRYQKAMISRLHGTAAFDRWDTSLANAASQREAVVPADQFCQQAAPMMQQAAALDIAGFRAYVASLAAAAAAAATAPTAASCRK